MVISRSLVASLAAGVATLALTLSAPAYAAAPSLTAPTLAATSVPAIGFQSSAYGTYVSAVDKAIVSGPTSSISLGCTSVTGLTRTNTAASVTLPGVGSTGTVSTKVTSAGSGTSRSTTATSTVQGVSLLGGAISASAIAVSSTASSNAGTPSGVGSTTFTGLKILGQSFSATVAPNTSVNLVVGGVKVGTVTLNGQAKATTNGVYSSVTRAITVRLLAGNPFGLPASTAIYIGSTSAGVTSTPHVVISTGGGFGVTASALDGRVLVGKQPNTSVLCYGGTQTGSVATVSVPGVLTTGTTTVATTSSGDATSASTAVTTNIAAPRILAGLISADAIVADVKTVRSSTGVITSSDNSRFVNLKVGGFPLLSTNPAPNTTINVAGLGSVTLHKTSKTANSMSVVMLEIKLKTAIAGLPTGTIIQLGGATAGVA